MTKKVKKHFIKTSVGTFLFIICFIISKTSMGNNGIFTLFKIGEFDFSVLFILFLITYFFIGSDVVIKALKNIMGLQMLDENFLMVIATFGAFFVGDCPEAVAVMVFYQIGEFFQEIAVMRARNSIKDLMSICPDEAVVIRSGEEEIVEPDEVKIGEIIRVKAGEKIPLDGVIVHGSASIDTKALTGESLPKDANEGEYVNSGCINLSGVIEVEVKKEFSESTVTKIIELVEDAQSRKGKSEKFITKFAHWYTPVVVVLALLLAIFWPITTVINHQEVLSFSLFRPYIYRALTFLVISCPCALVISIPLSFFGGIGGASKNGILIKGSNYLEELSVAKTVIMDKTGTITAGDFDVTHIVSLNTEYDKRDIIKILASMEAFSNHPLAKSVCSAFNRGNDDVSDISDISDIKEEAGYGILGVINNEKYIAGNRNMLNKYHIDAPFEEINGTYIYLAKEGKTVGYCVLEDMVKEDSENAILQLKKLGINDIVMLTGDKTEVAKKIADKVGISDYHAELLPNDKVSILEKKISTKAQKSSVIFVGDGINDAPVLARADIGIAMGAVGSDAAIEASDIVIMDDKLSKIASAIKIAKKTIMIVRENIVFAIGVKVLILMFAALGMAGMWWAVFADVGVAVIAIINAMRALYIKI